MKITNSSPYAHATARHIGRPDRHRKRSPAGQTQTMASTVIPSWPKIQVPMPAMPPFLPLSAWVMATVAHPCWACHHRSGIIKATAIAAPAANQRLSTGWST